METEDIYDQQIKELTKRPDLIENHWVDAKGLFKIIGQEPDNDNTLGSGCLTMIRNNTRCGAYIKGVRDEELTEQIRKDKRIPKHSQIKIKDLPVFAEWQRKIDLLQNS
jgi:hypothetical protein